MVLARDLQQARSVAVFDFDRTLIDRSSLLPFLRQLTGRSTLALRALQAGLHTIPRLNRARLKSQFVGSVLRGRPERDVEVVASRFAHELFATHLDEATVRELERHRAANDTILILSASLDVYLRPLAARLEIVHLVCTEVVHADGICTGELRNTQLHGTGKVRALRSWLAQRRFEDARVVAYGNSWQDRALLRFAERTQCRVTGETTSGM